MLLQALNLVPGRQLDLQDFVGTEATGHQDSIHKLTMARMGSGDASLSIQSQNEPNFIIEGRISDIKIPRECRPRFSRNDLEMMPGFLNDLGQTSTFVRFILSCRAFSAEALGRTNFPRAL